MNEKTKLPKLGDVAEQIKEYRRLWKKKGHEEVDEFLEKLFPSDCLSNGDGVDALSDTDKILIQICALDAFYGTQTPSKFLIPFAEKIRDSNFNERIKCECLDIVNTIANVDDKKHGHRNICSLSTKYCSFHNPDVYPIYDKRVGQMLLAFNEEQGHECFYDSCKSCGLTTKALAYDTASKRVVENYKEYCKLIEKFRECYELDKEEFSLKDIDRYLWLAGKRRAKGKAIII